MRTIKIGNYYITRNDPRFLLRKIKELTDENQKYKEVVDKAFQLLEVLHYKFPDYDGIHDDIEDIQKLLGGIK